MKRKKHTAGRLFHQEHKHVKRSPHDSVSDSASQAVHPDFQPDLPAGVAPTSSFLMACPRDAIDPGPPALGPYGFYNLLRLAVCVVSAWLAYEQWKHDDAGKRLVWLV